MSKNPYEIRFDLLNMAKDLLDKQYDQASNVAWSAFEKAAETNANIYKEIEQYIPRMFTPEEIISQAEKLQTFINKKD
tara:strand:+ start:3024 stop:3257 length:234 start_codon:yes stop_codon:yes gene_type:complete